MQFLKKEKELIAHAMACSSRMDRDPLKSVYILADACDPSTNQASFVFLSTYFEMMYPSLLVKDTTDSRIYSLSFCIVCVVDKQQNQNGGRLSMYA